MLPDFQLVEAVKSGSRENADLAIARGATLDARDLDGTSLLRTAEKTHQNNMARYLIQRGANIHVVDGRNGGTLLHLAARKENFGFANLLVEAGLSPNVQDARGLTPLHIAAKNGHEYFVRYLLDHQADPNRMARNGDSPLHLAARAGNIPIIQLLIRKNARSHPNFKHRTPFQEALKYHQLEAADLLKHLPDFPSETVSPIASSDLQRQTPVERAAESKGQSFSGQVRPPQDHHRLPSR